MLTFLLLPAHKGSINQEVSPLTFPHVVTAGRVQVNNVSSAGIWGISLRDVSKRFKQVGDRNVEILLNRLAIVYTEMMR